MSIPKKVLQINNSEIKKNIILYLISIIFAIICLLILLCILSNIICAIDIPLYTLNPLTTICCAIATFAGGMVFSWTKGEKGLVCGLVIAISLYVLLVIASAINNQLNMDTFSILKLISIFVAGCIGGFLGITFKEKLHHRH